MEKILVGINIPAIHERYDAFVPTEVPVAELAQIIASGVEYIADGKYSVSSLEMLSLKEPELLLDPKLTLKDYDIRDGMQLFLL